jgi:hypothetical protein
MNRSFNIICFNELNFSLWNEELGSKNLKGKIYSGNISESYESGFLEPWSQWPSFFYGVSASDLGIKELGQKPSNLSLKPLWDCDRKSTNLIIGMMNGTTINPNKNLIIPDPWTVDLESMPQDFQKLGESINNLATNYLNLSFFEKLSTFISISKLLKYVGILYFSKVLIFGTYWGFKTKFKNLVFIGIYELLLLRIAISLRTNKEYDRTILFFNTFAHIQHHYWKFKNNKPSAELAFGKEVFDWMIKILKKNDFFNQKYIIHNGLNQENCVNKEDWILYQPINHRLLFEKLLESSNFNTHEAMTNDGYLSFNSISDAEIAISKLNEWFLNGNKLFSLSRKDNKVFYRPYSFKPIRPDSKIHNLNQSNFFHFFDFFKFITRRTGRHIQSFNFITNVNDLYYPGINNANLGSRVFNE